MSSAPSGRYQSRLFNFVHQQSRRFKRQRDRALHQLQNTANWAVVGLSPLLSIFQLNRSSARQMHQAVEQPQLSAFDCGQSEPPDVDTPIQRVLLLVNVLFKERGVGGQGDKGTRGQGENPHTTHPTFHTPHPTLATRHSFLTRPIRGIATQLSSRALVLVTAQNEILDILTTQQQQQLQQQIVAVIADYWRCQRLAYLRGEGEQGRIMTSTLPLANSQLPTPNPKSKIYTDSVLAVLDRAVAEVESGKLLHLSAVATVFSLAQSVSQSSLQIVEQLKTQLDARSRDTAIASRSDFETSTNKIQTLIWAAINYFFGGGAKSHLEQSQSSSHLKESYLAGIPDIQVKKTLKAGVAASLTQQSSGLSKSKLSSTKLFSAQLNPSPLVDANLEDPWLTLEDLFGESAIASVTVTEQQSKQPRARGFSPRDRKPSLALASHKSARYSLSNFVRSIQKFWLQPKPESGLVQRQKVAQSEIVNKDSHQQVASLSQSSRPNRASEICDRTASQSTQMDAPDWIETHATVIGYVKHPLEQLLAWLDRAMLWLEELCIKVWQWLRQL